MIQELLYLGIWAYIDLSIILTKIFNYKNIVIFSILDAAKLF